MLWSWPIGIHYTVLHLLSSHLTHFWEKWDWADRSLNQSEDSICQILCQILFLSESSLSSPKLYQMAEPCSNLAQTLLKPCSNLAHISLKPCSNLAQILLKPHSNLAQTSLKCSESNAPNRRFESTLRINASNQRFESTLRINAPNQRSESMLRINAPKKLVQSLLKPRSNLAQTSLKPRSN